MLITTYNVKEEEEEKLKVKRLRLPRSDNPAEYALHNSLFRGTGTILTRSATFVTLTHIYTENQKFFFRFFSSFFFHLFRFPCAAAAAAASFLSGKQTAPPRFCLHDPVVLTHSSSSFTSGEVDTVFSLFLMFNCRRYFCCCD